MPEFGGFLGRQPPGTPLPPPPPQDSQIDTVIGRRWDIPRETHLHAWVTPPPPHCCLLLNSIGNQGWQPPVGGRGRFPWQPSAALSWLGREGRRPRKNSCRRALCEAATLVCWGKALMTPLFQIRAALSLRPFLPMFKKEPMAFKGGTSLEPQSLSRDSSPLVPEVLTYSIGDNDLSLPLF